MLVGSLLVKLGWLPLWGGFLTWYSRGIFIGKADNSFGFSVTDGNLIQLSSALPNSCFLPIPFVSIANLFYQNYLEKLKIKPDLYMVMNLHFVKSFPVMYQSCFFLLCLRLMVNVHHRSQCLWTAAFRMRAVCLWWFSTFVDSSLVLSSGSFLIVKRCLDSVVFSPLVKATYSLNIWMVLLVAQPLVKQCGSSQEASTFGLHGSSFGFMSLEIELILDTLAGWGTFAWCWQWVLQII